jgi:hypothetical protein
MKIIPEDAIQWTFNQVSEHYSDGIANEAPDWTIPSQPQDPEQGSPHYLWEYTGPKWEMAMIRFHTAFLESLFDRRGDVILFRGMHLEHKPRKGPRKDLGRHWTYSTDADLEDAQRSSGEYNTVIVARVSSGSIEWKLTLLNHVMGSHSGEKEISVSGPIGVLDVRPFSDFGKMGVVHDFDSWSRKNKKLWKKLLAEETP